MAVSTALAVVEPYSSGLGGGFWLLYRVPDGRKRMLDSRERAPLAARRDMYLDAQGRFVPERSLNGPLAASIPGQPAALAHLAEHYGRLSLARSLAPAIHLARTSFIVDAHYRRLAQQRLAETMRRAYRDRALYLGLGDPDAFEVPVERLTHPFYAAGLGRDIDPDRATPS